MVNLPIALKNTMYRVQLAVQERRMKQHLDNLRRKDSLGGAKITEIFVRLGIYSASHFEGSADSLLGMT
jgi:hypothetical protein